MAGVAALMPARAQTITSGPVTNPDSIVQITAESDGLSQVFRRICPEEAHIGG